MILFYAPHLKIYPFQPPISFPLPNTYTHTQTQPNEKELAGHYHLPTVLKSDLKLKLGMISKFKTQKIPKIHQNESTPEQTQQTKEDFFFSKPKSFS